MLILSSNSLQGSQQAHKNLSFQNCSILLFYYFQFLCFWCLFMWLNLFICFFILTRLILTSSSKARSSRPSPAAHMPSSSTFSSSPQFWNCFVYGLNCKTTSLCSMWVTSQEWEAAVRLLLMRAVLIYLVLNISLQRWIFLDSFYSHFCMLRQAFCLLTVNQ